MESVPPVFTSTRESTNYARLCRLLVDVGFSVLQDIFDRIYPPANLHLVLSSPLVLSTLQSLRKKRVLNSLQWGKLFPLDASTVSSANFDITLLMVLLRNICGLSPPVSTRNWHELPPESDNSIEANVVRIKWYRNSVYSHASEASVDDATFKALWQKITSAILALGSETNVSAMYETVISQLTTAESMDPAAEVLYVKSLSDWKKDDDSLKEVLEELEETMKLLWPCERSIKFLMKDEQENQESSHEKLGEIKVNPPEIYLRGPRALEAYNKALTEGKTRVKRIPIMLIGQARSGKTSLKNSLKGLQFNSNEDSTVAIDDDPSYFKVSTEIWKAGKRSQSSDVKTVAKSNVVHSSPTISSEAQSVKKGSEIPEDPPELSTAIMHDHVGSSANSFSTTQIEANEDYANSSKSSGAPHNDDSGVLQTTENYSAQTKARDNSSSLGMIPEEKEALIKKLRDEDEKMESEDDIYSVLWDFAGESVYYETHQLFLTSSAIYLLVYDLSRDPEESVQPIKKQGVFQKIEEMSTKTNLDYLDYWMTSVSSLSNRIEDHDFYSTSTSTVLPTKIPPVFLVCTHSDRPFEGKDPFELAIKLYGSLETKSYSSQLYDDVFVVDNTKSGAQTESSEVQRLRESILAVAKELPHAREDIPIKWLKYEKALQAMQIKGHKWITLKCAEQIASDVCQIHSVQECQTALAFLHNQRILLHFDDNVELSKLVVLDLQWLIDVFKTVITVKRFDRQERGFKDLWLKLEREGILEEKLLRHEWGQMVKDHHTFESLIAIMEKFSLLCSWSSSDEQCSKKYLVPSMLKWQVPEKVTKLIASARLPSLFLRFESGLAPSNLFPRLVVHFLQWGRNEFWSTVGPQLYKNFARFYTARDENCSVVLLCHSSLIEVVVHEGNDRLLKDDFPADVGISSGDQCVSFGEFCAREVFRQLVLLLEWLRKEFCWLKRMRYQGGVICPICCHERLVSFCTTHHKQDCEREECLHFISEKELRNANQSISCNRSAVAVNNKVYIKDYLAWFARLPEETTTDAVGGGLLCSQGESEERSLALSGNVVQSLSSPSCDPKEIVLQIKENLGLDQTDLKQPTPGTKKVIRCLGVTAKGSNRTDVIKHLREITPAGTTGPLLPGKLEIFDIPDKKRRHLTVDLTVGGQWKVVAQRLGLRENEIKFLDERYRNPGEAILAFAASRYGMNVDDLYDVLTECGMPVLADIL